MAGISGRADTRAIDGAIRCNRQLGQEWAKRFASEPRSTRRGSRPDGRTNDALLVLLLLAPPNSLLTERLLLLGNPSLAHPALSIPLFLSCSLLFGRGVVE